MVKDIVIRATLEGEGEVSAGFKRMSEHSKSLSTELRTYGRELASLGASAVGIARVGEQFGLLSKQQAGVITQMGGLVALGGTLMRTMGYLAKASWAVEVAEKARGAAHLFADTMASGIHKIGGAIIATFSAIASSSIAVTIAEHARAIAHAIANAVMSWGAAVPIMLGAAAAAAIGIGAYFTRMQAGGIVYKPTMALIGEAGPEVVVPLNKALKPFTINNYVTIQNPVFRSRSDIDYLVDRLRRMGKI